MPVMQAHSETAALMDGPASTTPPAQHVSLNYAWRPPPYLLQCQAQQGQREFNLGI